MCVWHTQVCGYRNRQSHNEPEGSAAAADTICIGQLILAQRKTSGTMTVIKTDSGGLRCLQYLLCVSGRPFRFNFFFKETSVFPPRSTFIMSIGPFTGFPSNAACFKRHMAKIRRSDMWRKQWLALRKSHSSGKEKLENQANGIQGGKKRLVMS